MAFTKQLIVALCAWMLTTLGACAQDDSCSVSPAHYVIFNGTDQPANFLGKRLTLVVIGSVEVERVECILNDFHDRCTDRSATFRDSLLAASRHNVTGNFGMVNLADAYRQYQAGRNGEGDILVHVNGMCRTDGDRWQESWIFVHDGGPCFWHAVINLTKGTIERLSVNGFA